MVANGEREKQMPRLKETLNSNIVKIALTILGMAAAVFFVTYNRQGDQNDKISDNVASIERLREYDKHSAEIFENLAEGMKEQRVIIRETRETLIEVKATQKHLIVEFEKLAVEVRRRNGDR